MQFKIPAELNIGANGPRTGDNIITCQSAHWGVCFVPTNKMEIFMRDIGRMMLIMGMELLQKKQEKYSQVIGKMVI